MKDRIRLLMESMHMTQKSFSDFIGVSPALLSSIFSERTKPTLNIVEALKSKIPNLNTDWLLFEKGSMFISESKINDNVSHQVNNSPIDQQLNFSVVSSTPSDSNSSNALRQSVNSTLNNYQKSDLKNFDKQRRNITEIRVFYDDQTWESFVPKKS